MKLTNKNPSRSIILVKEICFLMYTIEQLKIQDTKANANFVYQKRYPSLVPLTLKTSHVSKPRKKKGREKSYHDSTFFLITKGAPK